MRPAKFSKSGWPAFEYRGQTFDLSHLDEFRLSVHLTSEAAAQIFATFSDHCFTKDPEPRIDPALYYPHSDRRPGQFCFERYKCSYTLANLIIEASTQSVWVLQRDNYAILKPMKLDGEDLFYAVIFNLDPSRGLDTDLLMRIQTAHPRQDIKTFGSVRFKNLVQLRLSNKRPKLNYAQGRKIPTLL